MESPYARVAKQHLSTRSLARAVWLRAPAAAPWLWRWRCLVSVTSGAWSGGWVSSAMFCSLGRGRSRGRSVLCESDARRGRSPQFSPAGVAPPSHWGQSVAPQADAPMVRRLKRPAAVLAPPRRGQVRQLRADLATPGASRPKTGCQRRHQPRLGNSAQRLAAHPLEAVRTPCLLRSVGLCASKRPRAMVPVRGCAWRPWQSPPCYA